MRVITHRKICWPDPDATCLNGGCGWCNEYPYRSMRTIMRFAKQAGQIPHRGSGDDDAYEALMWGVGYEFGNVDKRWGDRADSGLRGRQA